MSNTSCTWICSFNSKARLFTVISTSSLSWENSNWTWLTRDPLVSDPSKNFEVFLSDNGQHLKAQIKADKYGEPISIHRNFRIELLGSPTLWGPHGMLGKDRGDFMWISRDRATMWIDDEIPEPWGTSPELF